VEACGRKFVIQARLPRLTLSHPPDAWPLKDRIMRKYACFTLAALFAFAGLLSAKPKMKVQLYGERFENKNGATFVYVYLVLPNGDHAEGMCMQVVSHCTIESFAPEKRRKSACTLPSDPSITMTCYESETYEADRKKNDITVYGGSGKITYHIYGFW
jgi:hypothetical protein